MGWGIFLGRRSIVFTRFFKRSVVSKNLRRLAWIFSIEVPLLQDSVLLK